MKKFLLSSFLILSFSFYAFYQRANGSDVTYLAPIKQPILATPPLGTVPNHPKYKVSGGDEEDDDNFFFSLGAKRTPGISSTTNTPAQTSPVVPMGTMMQSTQMGMMSNGIYKNGSFIGKVVDAYYGNVQVKAVVTNGKISDVIFLDYPHDRNTSVRINSQAMPYLKSEAIVAQSANVDAISGASATSGAFNESLASALAQAKI